MDIVLLFSQSPYYVVDYYITSHNNNLGYDVKAKPMEIILMHTTSIHGKHNIIIVFSPVQFFKRNRSILIVT